MLARGVANRPGIPVCQATGREVRQLRSVIENIGNKNNYMRKTYDVDQSGLPESYFDTLATAFEEHLEVADLIDGILDEAITNVRDE